MKSNLILIFVFLICQHYLAEAYYLSFTKDLEASENTRVIRKLKIITDKRSEQNSWSSDLKFPKKFKIQLSAFDEELDSEFHLIDKYDKSHPIASSHVFTNDKNSGEIVQHKFDKEEDLALYKSKDGSAFATLTKNSESNPNYENHPFKMVGTLTSRLFSDTVFHIIPLKNNENGRLEEEDLSELNEHVVRKGSSTFSASDEALYEHINKKAEENSENKFDESMKNFEGSRYKQAIQKPVNLYVELLVVTDWTVYEMFKNISITGDPNDILLNMKIYYMHMINGVNIRYQNSLVNDPDLNINIKLKNMLILRTTSIWSDSPNVTSLGIVDGREQIFISQSLTNFVNYMKSLSLSFTYDFAAGMTNKEYVSDSGTTGVAGRAYLGCKCSSCYSVQEDHGGFERISVIAHELGHNLGADHDGSGAQSTCPITDNYIMVPGLGSPNLLNAFRFSTCSINQFKAQFLNVDKTDILPAASCLLDYPVLNFEVPTGELPGNVFSPDDQCKQFLGSNASFCRFTNNDTENICLEMSCRPNSYSSDCEYFIYASGAADGTPCNSGKVCMQGKCVASDKAPIVTDGCVHGDDTSIFNSIYMPCNEQLDIFARTNTDPYAKCKGTYLGRRCCSSCKKYLTTTCYDYFTNCNSYLNYCSSTTATFGNMPFQLACQKACGFCKAETNCTNSGFLCQNGATCTSYNVATNPLLKFKCVCREGYYGEYCEFKNPCLPNPCLNGGTCENIGSLGFRCICNGVDCPTSQTTVTATNVASTGTTTTKPTTTITTTKPVTATKTTKSGATTTKPVTATKTTKPGATTTKPVTTTIKPVTGITTSKPVTSTIKPVTGITTTKPVTTTPTKIQTLKQLIASIQQLINAIQLILNTM